MKSQIRILQNQWVVLACFVLVGLGPVRATWASGSASSPAVPSGQAHESLPQTKSSAPKLEKVPAEVKGYCMILESPSNPMSGPCMNLVVILKLSDGTSFEKARTSAQGSFSFDVDSGTPYRLELGSKLYDIVSPKDFVHAGEKIELQIRQRN